MRHAELVRTTPLKAPSAPGHWKRFGAHCTPRMFAQPHRPSGSPPGHTMLSPIDAATAWLEANDFREALGPPSSSRDGNGSNSSADGAARLSAPDHEALWLQQQSPNVRSFSDPYMGFPDTISPGLQPVSCHEAGQPHLARQHSPLRPRSASGVHPCPVCRSMCQDVAVILSARRTIFCSSIGCLLARKASMVHNRLVHATACDACMHASGAS